MKDRYDEAHDRGSEGLDRLHQWRKNMVQNTLRIREVLNASKENAYFETETISINDILQITNKTTL